MSVAISNNNDQNQVLGLDEESKNPILKGKHVKDGKEILQEIVKDTTEAKAKIAEHLTQVMLEMKKAGLGDPLNNLSNNQAWQNFASPSLIYDKAASKSDEINMYMEIFKALNVSSQASNVDLASACRQMLSSNTMTAFIEKGSNQDLTDMQAKIQKAHDDYEYQKDHESFWDKLCDALAPVLAVIACVVTITVLVALAPATGGGTLALAGITAGVGIGLAMGMGAKQGNDKNYDNLADADTTTMNQASGDLSYKTQINQNSISRMQIDTQNANSLTENFENDKESIESVKKSVIEAIARVASSN